MVAPSGTPHFSPADPPRVAVASDGTLAAIAESTRVVVLEIPGGAPFAEVGVDPEALASEIAWVGAPPRLLVLSRFAAHSTAHLIDPYGPRTIAEIRLESPMKLFATVGAHALAVGAMGAAILSATETHLTPYQFPSRGVPATAGAAAGNFVVALGGSIEEWDPKSRMPKRRLRLPRPAVITAVGGSERVVWMTTQQEPERLDVLPLVNRGQPKVHELPERIASATGHPRSDLVVCVGADSGRLYVVDLDGRTRVRVIGPEGIDRTEAAALVFGRMVGVLAAQAGRPVAIVQLEGRDERPAASAAPPVAPPAAPAELPAGSTLGGGEEDDDEDLAPPPRSTLLEDDDRSDREDEREPAAAAPAPVVERMALPRPEPTPAPAPRPSPAPPRPAAPAPAPVTSAPDAPAPASWPSAFGSAAAGVGVDDRFGAWRERIRQGQPRPDAPGAPRGPSWRDQLVTWARGIAGGSLAHGTPAAPAITEVAQRFDLPESLVPGLVLLYGAHLCGESGAAPVDVARVLGGRWDEALGGGILAARGLATYAESRVRLAPAVQRVIDELPPASGTIVGEAGAIALLGPCAVVAGTEPLLEVARRHVASVRGAILVAHDDADPGDVFLEARARGAAPMLRISRGDLLELGTDPAILVVPDDATADELGVPRLG